MIDAFEAVVRLVRMFLIDHSMIHIFEKMISLILLTEAELSRFVFTKYMFYYLYYEISLLID